MLLKHTRGDTARLRLKCEDLAADGVTWSVRDFTGYTLRWIIVSTDPQAGVVLVNSAGVWDDLVNGIAGYDPQPGDFPGANVIEYAETEIEATSQLGVVETYPKRVGKQPTLIIPQLG